MLDNAKSTDIQFTAQDMFVEQPSPGPKHSKWWLQRNHWTLGWVAFLLTTTLYEHSIKEIMIETSNCGISYQHIQWKARFSKPVFSRMA